MIEGTTELTLPMLNPPLLPLGHSHLPDHSHQVAVLGFLFLEFRLLVLWPNIWRLVAIDVQTFGKSLLDGRARCRKLVG